MSEAPAKARKRRQPGEAIAITDIILHKRCQARVELKEDAVEHYAQLYREKGEGEVEPLPPIKTFDVEGVGRVVVDGYHRVSAMAATGTGFIRHISVGEGTIEEAAALALEANGAHGLPLSNADKRKAIDMAIDLGWFEKRNQNRKVARRLGVSDKLVRTVREEQKKAEASADKRSDAPANEDREPEANADKRSDEPEATDPSSEPSKGSHEPEKPTTKAKPRSKHETPEAIAKKLFAKWGEEFCRELVPALANMMTPATQTSEAAE